MQKPTIIIIGLLMSFGLGFYLSTLRSKSIENRRVMADSTKTINMEIPKNLSLGAFSVSLNVKDLRASKEFYEHLGFTVLGGAIEQNYLILKNGNALIGIFQGMFENNILTFNPGWDESGTNFDPYDDVRKIQQQLKTKEVQLDTEVDTGTSGPGSMLLKDPDGNIILIDQHR